jgi:hypothetical protein
MFDRGSEIGNRETADGQRGSRFDRAIDRTVREMLDVEPRADLRARVMRRLSDSDLQVASGVSGKIRFGRKLLWTAVPLAAAATLVLALLLPSRTAPDRQPESRVATTTPAPVPAPAPSRTVSTPAPSRVAAGSARVPAAARPRISTTGERTVIAAAYAPQEFTTDIEPLKSITPIEMAPIAEHRVATAEISVRPLNPILDLQITPLSPPDRRH